VELLGPGFIFGLTRSSYSLAVHRVEVDEPDRTRAIAILTLGNGKNVAPSVTIWE
jgi:hypothetical protein